MLQRLYHRHHEIDHHCERREIWPTIFKELEDAVVGILVFPSGDAVYDGHSFGTIDDHM